MECDLGQISHENTMYYWKFCRIFFLGSHKFPSFCWLQGRMGWGLYNKSSPPSNIVNHMNMYSLKENFIIKLKSNIYWITFTSVSQQIPKHVLGKNYSVTFIYLLKIT